MIVRDPRRLRALFQGLVALASAGACTAGCSSPDDGSDGGPPGEAGVDATSPGVDGGMDAADASMGPTDAPNAASDTACGASFLDGADDGNGCDYFEGLTCGAPPVNESCYLYLPECARLCGVSVAYPCFVVGCEDDGGLPPQPWTLECTTGKTGCGDAGRRPAGLVDAEPACASDAVGAWLARVARLEAASVVAFRRLAVELEAMGAPRSLVTQATRSANDETRHARVTSRLARARGARPARVRVVATKARTPRDLAVENAVEGCVRESFAALVATWQARHAKDPAIARAMGVLARDETRHAALAWSVASWLGGRLDEDARAEVAAATRGALEALRREVASTPAALEVGAGLPGARAATALLDGFAAALFA